jgi:hypothetical protein
VAARYAAALPLLVLLLAACGPGAKSGPAAGGPCLDEDPGKRAIYATRDVAFAWDPTLREGSAVQSAASEGELPWFAKTGLFIRGDDSVVVRVPERQDVRIEGWYGPGSDGELRSEVLVEPVEGCPSQWTAYPGGLRFAGRQCVRVEIEGPAGQTGSALFGLRRNCSR